MIAEVATWLAADKGKRAVIIGLVLAFLSASAMIYINVASAVLGVVSIVPEWTLMALYLLTIIFAMASWYDLTARVRDWAVGKLAHEQNKGPPR